MKRIRLRDFIVIAQLYSVHKHNEIGAHYTASRISNGSVFLMSPVIVSIFMSSSEFPVVKESHQQHHQSNHHNDENIPEEEEDGGLSVRCCKDNREYMIMSKVQITEEFCSACTESVKVKDKYLSLYWFG